MAEHKEYGEEALAMEWTSTRSTVEQSSPNSGPDDELESGEWNQLQTGYVQKPSEVIDQVQYSLEKNIQEFSEGMPPTNNQLLEETECEEKLLGDRAELIRHHYRLNYLSFRELKAQEKLSIISRRLRNVQPPKCSDCQIWYIEEGAMHK